MDQVRKDFIEGLIEEGDYATCARTTYKFNEERAYAETLVFEQGGQEALDRFLRIAASERSAYERRAWERKYKSENFWDIAYGKALMAERNERRERRRQVIRKMCSLVELVVWRK